MKSRKALRLQIVALGKQLEESVVILNGFDRDKQYNHFDRQKDAIAVMGRAIESFAKVCALALEKPEAALREVDIAPTQTQLEMSEYPAIDYPPQEVRRVGFQPNA